MSMNVQKGTYLTIPQTGYSRQPQSLKKGTRMFISIIFRLLISFRNRRKNLEAPFGLDEGQSVGGIFLAIKRISRFPDSNPQKGVCTV